MTTHAPVRRSYEQLAPTYDRRWQRYLDATLSLALEPLAPAGAPRILDIACGTGELERRLGRLWPEARLTGVDLTPSMLRRASAKGLDAEWLAADSTHLPLASASFNYVLCVNAFHYFRTPERSLAEMRRVLREDGTLVLVDWCDDYLSCKLCSLWLRWTDPAFHQTYSTAACRSLVESAGFSRIFAERRRVGLWGLMRFVCRL